METVSWILLRKLERICGKHRSDPGGHYRSIGLCGRKEGWAYLLRRLLSWKNKPECPPCQPKMAFDAGKNFSVPGCRKPLLFMVFRPGSRTISPGDPEKF